MKSNHSFDRKEDPSRFNSMRGELNLDTGQGGWYNTFRGLGKKNEKMFKKVEDDKLVFGGDKPQQMEVLKRLDAAAKEVAAKIGMKPPVIAGGAVRDTLLGYYARDFDIFLLGVENTDEGQDDVAYFFGKFLETGCCHPTRIKNKSNYNNDTSKIVDVYVAYEDDGRYNRPIDVIGRVENDVSELIADFDHDLVLCYYDDWLMIHENMLKALSKGRVESRDYLASDRLQTWRLRTGHKITIGRPPAKSRLMYSSGGTGGISKVHYANVRDRNAVWENLILNGNGGNVLNRMEL